MIIIIFWAH